MNRFNHCASIVLSAVSLGLPALAGAVQPGVYFGAGFGVADDEILHETASATKLFGGINATRHIGVEVSYVDLGDYVNGALQQDGVAFELAGYLPLNQRVDLFGKFGLFNWEVRSGSLSVEGTDPVFGAGLLVSLTREVNLRGEWQVFTDVDGGDVDLYSASLSYHF